MSVTILLVSVLITLIESSQQVDHPNIVFIYVDDVGFNDFGFNKNTLTQTPFLDSLLKEESLLIDHNYVSFVCSPTRAQFLSGRYASHLGLQHSVFMENTPYSLTRQVSLLSNEFQSNGYSTHLIGKFHLGFQAWEYTPTYRGFDTFQGFYNGEETYFNHQGWTGNLTYYDLRNNEDPDPNHSTYSVYLHRDKFLSLMDNIDSDESDDSEENQNPFFIYLAFQAAHTPSEAPYQYISLYCDPYNNNTDNSTVTEKADLPGNCTSHHIHMAQMTSMDDAMQVIVNRLKENKNVWDNTLVIFSSDNGGAMETGDNAPLRGGKGTSFEGGVRVPGFVTGGYLNQNRRGQVLDEFPVHVTDWYLTLLSAANLDLNYERSKKLHESSIDDDEIDTKWDYIDEYNIEIPIDGKNIWNAIQNNIISNELLDREILLHLDEINCSFAACGALIYRNWKFIRGPDVCESNDCGWNNVFMTDPNNNVLNCAMTANDDNLTTNVITHGVYNIMDDEIGDFDWTSYSCSDGCLFDLSIDPCEYNNLINDTDLSHIVEIMENKLLLHQQQAVLPLMGPDEITLSNDEVNPTIVCDSEYWCPYMKYDNVQFEIILYHEYMRLYGPFNDIDNMDDNENNKAKVLLLYTLLLIITLIVFVWIYTCLQWNVPKNDEKIVDEQSPLLQKV